MGYLSAALFARIQRAQFYQAAHQDAVALLPLGTGKTWLDVGCGAGLVTLLAAQRGYTSLGIDRDAAMLVQAQRHARGKNVQFLQGDVATLAQHCAPAEVVSAASLLAMIAPHERQVALQQLARQVKSGGNLLLIEPSALFNYRQAATYLKHHPQGHDSWVLRLWGITRQPQRAITAADLAFLRWDTQCHPLLGGLVNAWCLTAPGNHTRI